MDEFQRPVGMEIDDFLAICGHHRASLWPGDSRHLIRNALVEAANGPTVRFQADATALVIGELAVNWAKHGATAQGSTVDAAPPAMEPLWTSPGRRSRTAQ